MSSSKSISIGIDVFVLCQCVTWDCDENGWFKIIYKDLLSFVNITFKPCTSYWKLSDATCLQNFLFFPTRLKNVYASKTFSVLILTSAFDWSNFVIKCATSADALLAL